MALSKTEVHLNYINVNGRLTPIKAPININGRLIYGGKPGPKTLVLGCRLQLILLRCLKRHVIDLFLGLCWLVM